jgi:hypothetical protein
VYQIVTLSVILLAYTTIIISQLCPRTSSSPQTHKYMYPARVLFGWFVKLDGRRGSHSKCRMFLNSCISFSLSFQSKWSGHEPMEFRKFDKEYAECGESRCFYSTITLFRFSISRQKESFILMRFFYIYVYSSHSILCVAHETKLLGQRFALVVNYLQTPTDWV